MFHCYVRLPECKHIFWTFWNLWPISCQTAKTRTSICRMFQGKSRAKPTVSLCFILWKFDRWPKEVLVDPSKVHFLKAIKEGVAFLPSSDSDEENIYLYFLSIFILFFVALDLTQRHLVPWWYGAHSMLWRGASALQWCALSIWGQCIPNYPLGTRPSQQLSWKNSSFVFRIWDPSRSLYMELYIGPLKMAKNKWVTRVVSPL